MITSTEFIAFAICFILVLLIVGWYWRIVHDIAKRNRLLEAQMELLGKIAEKSGVSRDEVIDIISKGRVK